MGYPELDIVQYRDGEWAIIQYMRSPVVPCLTPWQVVLSKMRHVEKTYSVMHKYASQLDIEKRSVWANQERIEKKAKDDLAREERHANDIADRQFKVIKGNSALMERIAKNGLGEMGLRQLAKRIPNHHYR
jgi:hypothetical protein